MKSTFKKLRAKQIERALSSFGASAGLSRPSKGWIRAIREAAGITLKEVGSRLQRTAASIAYLERAEADYRITLGNLRDAAEALGCELVYAFVPREGSIHKLMENRARALARENVLAVEHTMALEGQAVGNLEEKIDELTKGALDKA